MGVADLGGTLMANREILELSPDWNLVMETADNIVYSDDSHVCLD